MKAFGKMHYEPVEIPAVMFFRFDEAAPDQVMIPARTFQRLVAEDGTPWNDVCKDLPTGSGIWYIVVLPDGWIAGAECDPTMLALADHDFWQIEHDGPDTDIRRHRWTGTEVAPWPEEAA